MAQEKVTTMVLNVDLQCSKCYKKIKKLLCKFPEIRDQTYDEKANKVTIKVVSCSPEKIRDKLYCKGGGCIKSIEIIKSPPPDGRPPDGKPPGGKPPDGKPPGGKPPDGKPPGGKPPGGKPPDGKPPGGKPPDGKPPPPPCKDKPVKVSVDLQVQGFCYCKCCSGRPRGPCSCGGQFQCVLCYCKCCSGRPWGPCSCGGQGLCIVCYGRPVCDSWCGHGSGCEETQPGCSIM